MKKNPFFAVIVLGALICLPVMSFCQPDIQVFPDHIDFNFPGNGEDPIQEAILTIRNVGNDDLQWMGNLEFQQEPQQNAPLRDDAGELIAIFDIKNANEYAVAIPCGLNDNLVWVTDFADQLARCYSFDPQYQEINEVLRIAPGQCIDGAWANETLYLPPFNSNIINRFNQAGQNIGATEMPFPIVGIAADDRENWLFLMSAEDEFIHVFNFEEDGAIDEEIGVIENHLQYHNNSESFGLEWVHKHPDGQLWMIAPNTGRVHQIAVDTQNWICTGEAQQPFLVSPGNQEMRESAVGHDGHFMWAGGFRPENVRVYDDGVEENYRLTLEPLEGTIEPGSDTEIVFYFNATELLGGEYRATLHIMSNDPDNEQVDVMITGTVMGQPELSVEWPEEAGFPEIIDFNMQFIDGIDVGADYSIPIVFRNVGTDLMEIMEIATHSEQFSIDFEDGIILAPDEWVEMTLSFRTEEPGEWDEALWITSNAPGGEDLSIPLHATTFDPPVISIDPDSIRQVLDWREAAEQIITLANDGESDLRWLAEIEPVPIRDEYNEALITIDPATGVVEAGASIDLVLFMEFIESDSLPDLYNLTFTSNDPVNPEVVIPITVHCLDVSESKGALLPAASRLVSLYPNPFNSSTTISFGLDKSAPTRLAVYGVDGRLVADLVTGRDAYPPGYHSVVWNAEGVPAGSYLVRLETKGGAEEQWVRLVK